MSPSVKVCGCRPHDGGAAHTGGRRTQTSKGGNRGKGYVRRCGVGYRELSTARNFDFVAGGFSKNLGLEYVHNFCVMAQGLLTVENGFLSPCDFKELRVIKRARFTTSTLAASQRSLNSIARTDRRESRKNSTHATAHSAPSRSFSSTVHARSPNRWRGENDRCHVELWHIVSIPRVVRHGGYRGDCVAKLFAAPLRYISEGPAIRPRADRLPFNGCRTDTLPSQTVRSTCDFDDNRKEVSATSTASFMGMRLSVSRPLNLQERRYSGPRGMSQRCQKAASEDAIPTKKKSSLRLILLAFGAAKAQLHWALMPASRMTFAHLAPSVLNRAAASSGVLPTASKPSVAIFSMMSGSAMILTISRWSSVVISIGVPAGTMNANHPSPSTSG